MIKIALKGGSLSLTSLCIDGEDKYVRKEVSLSKNREYGYQRWYSQLKKLQRYQHQFPDIFPKILRFGQSNGMAYFDMEYLKDFETAHHFLTHTDNHYEIKLFINALLDTMSRLHGKGWASNPEAIYLYLHEEVDKPIVHCMTNKFFANFLKYKEIYFNGQLVPSFIRQMELYTSMFNQYVNPRETFTHGNITLENILYSSKLNKIVFIDPYEENVIDSVLAEYSQLYQSSHALYEVYNMATPVVHNNQVNIVVPFHAGLQYFDNHFTDYVHSVCDDTQFTIIRLLEISQFIRMLPFKMEVDQSKMILFYALASKLFADLRNDA